MPQHEPLFLGTENGAPITARNCQSQLSLKNFLNRRRARQEVLRKYSGANKRTLFKKCRKLQLSGEGRLPGAWNILPG
jgi:hypothetical protein